MVGGSEQKYERSSPEFSSGSRVYLEDHLNRVFGVYYIEGSLGGLSRVPG